MGDQQHAQVVVELGVHAFGDDPERIDVQTRVRLVEDRHLRLQHRHLEHLQTLLLAAREALVDVARGERLVHLEERHLLAHPAAEVEHRHAALDGVRGVDVGVLVDALEPGVQRRADEAGDAQPGDRGGVLEREEQPQPCALVGRQREQVVALPQHLAAVDDVRRVAHQRVRERGLARAVGAHDRVDLALADGEVDPLEDLAVGLGGRRDAEAADDELAIGGGVGHEVAPWRAVGGSIGGVASWRAGGVE